FGGVAVGRTTTAAEQWEFGEVLEWLGCACHIGFVVVIGQHQGSSDKPEEMGQQLQRFNSSCSAPTAAAVTSGGCSRWRYGRKTGANLGKFRKCSNNRNCCCKMGYGSSAANRKDFDSSTVGEKTTPG
ncbi:hypothetical protein F0562_007508, partial [Nyssa sinensis]